MVLEESRNIRWQLYRINDRPSDRIWIKIKKCRNFRACYAGIYIHYVENTLDYVEILTI